MKNSKYYKVIIFIFCAMIIPVVYFSSMFPIYKKDSGLLLFIFDRLSITYLFVFPFLLTYVIYKLISDSMFIQKIINTKTKNISIAGHEFLSILSCIPTAILCSGIAYITFNYFYNYWGKNLWLWVKPICVGFAIIGGFSVLAVIYGLWTYIIDVIFFNQHRTFASGSLTQYTKYSCKNCKVGLSLFDIPYGRGKTYKCPNCGTNMYI